MSSENNPASRAETKHLHQQQQRRRLTQQELEALLNNDQEDTECIEVRSWAQLSKEEQCRYLTIAFQNATMHKDSDD